MDIFNRARESFAAAGKGFSQKASDVSEIARMTMKVREKERMLEQAVQELGMLLFNQRNEESMQMFPQQTEEIRRLYAALQTDREALALLKGKKICPNCGGELEGEAQHCPNCGMGAVRPGPVQAFCRNCGSPLAPDSKFCNSCGTKVE